MPTYNPKEVTLVWQGFIITGFAKGSRISVARDNAAVTLTKGGDDNHCYSISNDSAGKIVFRLLQSSPSNDFLSEQANLQELTGEGEGEAMVKDNSGRSLHFAAESRLEKPADSEFEQEAGVREWTLLCPRLEMFNGGN